MGYPQLPTSWVTPDYMFNGWLTGSSVSSVPHPALTVLVLGNLRRRRLFWHRPQSEYVLVNNPPGAPPYLHAAYNNALNEVGFVDGHVDYLKIYNDGMSMSDGYDPIPGYDYQWSKK